MIHVARLAAGFGIGVALALIGQALSVPFAITVVATLIVCFAVGYATAGWGHRG